MPLLSLVDSSPSRAAWRHLAVVALALATAGCEGTGGDGADSGTDGTTGSADTGPIATSNGGADSTDNDSTGSDSATGDPATDGSSGGDGSSSGDSTGDETGPSECGDLANDPNNCGFCDHSCGDAACVDGLCEPTVFANSEVGPQDLVANDDYLFWVDYSAAVLRCAKTGCPEGPELFSPHSRVASLWIDNEVLYFGSFETEQVLSCPVGGCGPGATVLASDIVNPFGLHVSDDIVYFMSGESVLSCPTTGCPGAPTVLATGMEPLSADVVGDALFFSDRMADQIRRCDSIDCAGESPVVAPDQDGALDMQPYGDHLYWVNQAGGEVRRCELADCASTIETLATDQQGPTRIAVDDDGVYWVNFGPAVGSVAGCPDHTCSEGPYLYANNQQGPLGIQLDDDTIYWVAYGTGFGGGGVYSVPK